MSSGFWNATLTQSTSSNEDSWTVMARTEIFWDIRDIVCFNSAGCCTWWMDLQYSPLNTISHMTVCKVIFKGERDVWLEPRTSYILIGVWETELDLIVVACLSFLTRLADYIHLLPREMKERRWTVVYRGGFLLLSPLSSSCFIHFSHSYFIVCAKGLLSSDLMYSVAGILFKHKHKPSIGNHLRLWVFRYLE